MKEQLYYEMMDFDVMDYADTYEQDIQFIDALIEAVGVDTARAVLREMVEG